MLVACESILNILAKQIQLIMDFFSVHNMSDGDLTSFKDSRFDSASVEYILYMTSTLDLGERDTTSVWMG